MKNVRLTKVAGALVLALGVSASAFASETSSSMRGKVTTPEGNAAANVKVTVIHEPTGTVSQFVTNDSGAFIAKGLRVGGPYKVILDSDAYRDSELNNIYLDLGQTRRVTSQLEPKKIETISISGYKIVQQAGGSSSVFGEETLRNMPSFNNDLKDVARLNPLASVNGAGELTIAGNNPKTNSFTVDGIGQNDDFGLSSGGYPTQQPPVALDAIEQVSVDAAPFSAKKGNFGGGQINAVTKSGSNDYTFTGFYEFSNPSLAGDLDSLSYRTKEVKRDDGSVRTERDFDKDGHVQIDTDTNASILNEKRFGFSTGGAIVKDELFYFVNYNAWRQTEELNYGWAGSDATHEHTVSADEYNRFINILSDTYGLTDDLGGDPENTNDTLLVKLSWNISDAHRADFTYQWQDDNQDREYSDGEDEVRLASRRFTEEKTFNNFATKIYSDWTDSFSTEIGLAYKDVSSESANNSDLGTVSVNVEGGRGPGFEFGRDEFRHANISETETTALTFDGTYFYGDHEINFGAHLESLRLYNLFAANTKGSWKFNSLEDFAAGTIDEFTYRNAYTNNADDLAYDATRKQFAIYVEDKFYPTDDLELNVGLRYERLSSSDKPTLNQSFVNTYKFSNQENLDGLDIILPRIGFKYYATEALTINGGIGRFQGGIPNVWYNNPYQNDGITYVSAPQSALDAYVEANNALAAGSSNKITAAGFGNVPASVQGALLQGAGSTNYTDPNFELPSSVRAQIGFDYEFDSEMLGDGFKWSAELSYHKKENEAVWYNTALVTPPEGQLSTSKDGRQIYTSRYEGDAAENFDIMMTNSDEDVRSIIFTTSLAKEFDNGLYVSASYTHQDIEDVAPGSSSRAQSNYKHAVTQSRNVDHVSTGYYEIEHSFKVNLSYSTQFFDGYDSQFNVFFERRSGRPFSYVMGFFRDGAYGDTRDFYSNSAYLAYIPSGADDTAVNWDESSISWSELETLLNRAGISERGQILDRNTYKQPWVTSMDVSFKQEIPGFYADHKAQLYVMIENFANLLNSDWGQERRLQFPNQSVYDFGGLDDEGRLILDNRFNGADVRNYNEIDENKSAWRAKIGVRYTF
ncbi:TonB-dependent receptor [Pseudoalteromonas obscura]|uniref:TonB-dependent receptor n=1 Tax=Pseudoalteromonas obscura TaxID=3048491 RepID=A0ABT7EQQ8_9GAMM|nr:TonB-dependent receptor [Pseudoalteromonas sp. P94(2023)]MDK2597328.1 TonB-dependent receptor [Pseudoalteromonas sp. P94(2023)]